MLSHLHLPFGASRTGPGNLSQHIEPSAAQTVIILCSPSIRYEYGCVFIFLSPSLAVSLSLTQPMIAFLLYHQ